LSSEIVKPAIIADPEDWTERAGVAKRDEKTVEGTEVAADDPSDDPAKGGIKVDV
jgi:hypothetical protein